MKKTLIVFIWLILILPLLVLGAEKDLEVKGKRLISKKPPFSLPLPSEFRLAHFTTVENPAENSLTRTSILIREKGKQVEEMLILQIADKTNPQAGPMIAPPLRPYAEKRLYGKGRVKKKETEIEYLIQLMAWNPEAPSLQPIVKKGSVVPAHWALQGQMLFPFEGEHAVFIRYSKDVRSFGLKVSDKGDDWNKDSLSGIEKKAYETFEKAFMEMMDSLRF